MTPVPRLAPPVSRYKSVLFGPTVGENVSFELWLPSNAMFVSSVTCAVQLLNVIPVLVQVIPRYCARAGSRNDAPKRLINSTFPPAFRYERHGVSAQSTRSPLKSLPPQITAEYCPRTLAGTEPCPNGSGRFAGYPPAGSADASH